MLLQPLPLLWEGQSALYRALVKIAYALLTKQKLNLRTMQVQGFMRVFFLSPEILPTQAKGGLMQSILSVTAVRFHLLPVVSAQDVGFYYDITKYQ